MLWSWDGGGQTGHDFATLVTLFPGRHYTQTLLFLFEIVKLLSLETNFFY